MAKIKKQNKPETAIPTASMSDISFLLLLFFMVSTVFVKEKGLRVTLPQASEQSRDKIPRKHSATFYVNKSGLITLDDYALEIPQIEYKMRIKHAEDYNLIVCFRADAQVEYGVMSDILNQLRNAETLKVSFEAKKKQGR